MKTKTSKELTMVRALFAVGLLVLPRTVANTITASFLLAVPICIVVTEDFL